MTTVEATSAPAPSRQRVLDALCCTREPDRVPIDFGSTTVTGIHVSCVAALRDHFGSRTGPSRCTSRSSCWACSIKTSSRRSASTSRACSGGEPCSDSRTRTGSPGVSTGSKCSWRVSSRPRWTRMGTR